MNGIKGTDQQQFRSASHKRGKYQELTATRSIIHTQTQIHKHTVPRDRKPTGDCPATDPSRHKHHHHTAHTHHTIHTNADGPECPSLCYHLHIYQCPQLLCGLLRRRPILWHRCRRQCTRSVLRTHRTRGALRRSCSLRRPPQTIRRYTQLRLSSSCIILTSRTHRARRTIGRRRVRSFCRCVPVVATASMPAASACTLSSAVGGGKMAHQRSIKPCRWDRATSKEGTGVA
jgi:hypothetical protein